MNLEIRAKPLRETDCMRVTHDGGMPVTPAHERVLGYLWPCETVRHPVSVPGLAPHRELPHPL